MKIGDTYVGFTGEEIVAAVMGNDIDALKAMIEGFELKRTFEPRQLTIEGWKVSSSLLNLASVFAGRSMLSQETATLLIDNLSMDVNVFLFLQVLAIYLHREKREDEPYVSKEIMAILEKNEPNDELAGRIAMMNENEFLSLCDYLISDKMEKLNITFTPPLVRFVYTHQMMPLTLLFAYMASTLRLPAPKIEIANVGDIVGQLLDGIFGGLEAPDGETST
ncbi:hypothetical protein IJI89_01470 [Candidatus Saccharibacteria bacterium]|nr:hypothetical protein [Candidatus Saccharibacteria bacterium]